MIDLRHVNTRQFKKIFKLTTKQVHSYVKRGMPCMIEQGFEYKKYYFNVWDCIDWIESNLARMPI